MSQQSIAQRLKHIREERYGKRGMTAFANEIGISPSGYLNYERGVRAIPSNVLEKIAQFTNVNLHWLLTGEGTPYNLEAQDAGPSESPSVSAERDREQDSPMLLTRGIPTDPAFGLLDSADQRRLRDTLDRYYFRFNRFQSLFHLEVLRGFERSIGVEMRGELDTIPELAKHTLIRATVGTVMGVLAPEFIWYMAEGDPWQALEYIPWIPDSLIQDKMSCYELMLDRLFELEDTTLLPRMLEDAQVMVQHRDDPFEQMRYQLSVIRLYARAGEMGKAQSLLAGVWERLPEITAPQEQLVKFHRQLAEAEMELGRLNHARWQLDHALALGRETLTEPEALDIHLSRCVVQYTLLSLKFLGQRNRRMTEALLKKARTLIEQIQDPWHQVEAIVEGVLCHAWFVNDREQTQLERKRVFEIAQRISESAKRSKAFAIIVDEYSHYDEEALMSVQQWADQIPEPMEAASAWLSIALAYLGYGRQGPARAALDRALQFAEKSDSAYGRTMLLHIVADRLIRNRELHLAVRFAGRALWEGWTGESLRLRARVLHAILAQGDVPFVRKELSRLDERVDQVRIAGLRISCMLQLARLYQGLGEFDRVKTQLDEVEQLLQMVDEPDKKIAILLELATVHADAGDEVTAERVVEQAETLVSAQRDTSAILHVASAWVRRGDLSRAERLIEEEMHDPTHVELLNQLIKTEIDIGALERAGLLLHVARETPGEIVAAVFRARHLAVSGDSPGARQILTDAVQRAAQFHLPDNRARAHLAIAEVALALDDADNALCNAQQALRAASWVTRDVALGVVEALIPLLGSLGGASLLSGLYSQIQRVDIVLGDMSPSNDLQEAQSVRPQT